MQRNRAILAWQLTDVPFVALDFETTGLDKPRALEVALMRFGVGNGDMQVYDQFSTLLNPGGAFQIEAGATLKHGITETDVQNSPTLRQVINDVMTMMDGAIIVGHNIAFDLGVLQDECRRQSLDLLAPAVIMDTLALSRAVYPKFEQYNLDYLARVLDLPAVTHRAAHDADATAHLLHRMIKDDRVSRLAHWAHVPSRERIYLL